MEFNEKSNQYAQFFETSAVTAAKLVEDDTQVLNKYQNQHRRHHDGDDEAAHHQRHI